MAFLRLRLPSQHLYDEKYFLPVLDKEDIIREVHSYGQIIPFNIRKRGAVQHSGFGKKLVREAERIAKREFSVEKIVVISGVGVRDYYRKLGYWLREEYMVKNIGKREL